MAGGAKTKKVVEVTMKKTMLVAIAFALTTTAANAQSVRNTVLTFGLFGTWAPSCSDPPAPGNSHTVFSVTSTGVIRVLNDFGHDYDDMIYDIISARRVAPANIALREVLLADPNVVLDVVMQRDGERVRIWSSYDAAGTPLVVRGMFPNSRGQQTRWAARCDERRA